MFDSEKISPSFTGRNPLEYRYEPAGYQLCPLCEGLCKVKSQIDKPNSEQKLEEECHVCDGKGIIHKVTGKPPKDES